jgi:hypothetical protein
MRFAFPILLAAICPASSAQEPAPPDLIDHLVANAAFYSATLPSISATEVIESQGSYLILHKTVRARGLMRVHRNPANGEIDESRQINEVDGKPLSPGHNPGLPWTLYGGFGKFQELFFTPAHRVCYKFTLLPEPGPAGTQQIDIAEIPAIAVTPGCTERGITGRAGVDPKTRQLVYLERTVPNAVAFRNRLAPYASVELAPTKIGDETYWLPAVVISTVVDGKSRAKFTAHYSDYHRYTGSITILPGVNEVEPPPAPAKPPPPNL